MSARRDNDLARLDYDILDNADFIWIMELIATLEIRGLDVTFDIIGGNRLSEVDKIRQVRQILQGMEFPL